VNSVVNALQLQIEKLVYGGDGLARLPADDKGPGKTIFLPFVIPGEKVEAALAETRPGFARAQLNHVIDASAERVEPGCPYFGRCGGCQYQHIDYQAQLRYKSEILRETLRRTAKLELQGEIQVHAAEPWHYRNRTRMRIQTAPKFLLGYHRNASHQLLPVEECPISSPLINDAIRAVWKFGNEGAIPAPAHGIQFFANHDQQQMLVELYVSPGSDAREYQSFAAALHAAMPAIQGVAVFVSSPAEDESRQFAPLTSAHSEPGQAIGNGELRYRVADHEFRVSAGSFFQTNRFLVEELAQVAVGEYKGRAALDLYAGVGLFTLPLSLRFDEVLAVEASPTSFADLRNNAAANVKPIRATTEAFLTERGPKLAPDLILVDPPRAGLGEKTARALGRMSVPRVTYVSCDPATLARDLRVLLESGFKVQQAHLFDLFPQTSHMETILHLAR
jgi:23S rRNA (uracil1939-C5)-methyltransferase